MADVLRDFGRVVSRNRHLLLPGFIVFATTHGWPRYGWTYLVFLVFCVLVAGYLVDALRGVTFEPLREFWFQGTPAPDATDYALYANLATLIAIGGLVHAIRGAAAGWDFEGSHVGLLFAWLFVLFALTFAAKRNFVAEKQPASRKKATTRRKKTG